MVSRNVQGAAHHPQTVSRQLGWVAHEVECSNSLFLLRHDGLHLADMAHGQLQLCFSHSRAFLPRQPPAPHRLDVSLASSPQPLRPKNSARPAEAETGASLSEETPMRAHSGRHAGRYRAP